MDLEKESEESVPLENHPEWPSYVKHYEELEKAQSRIGKTSLKTMQWVCRLLALRDKQLGRMSQGDFENVSYELAVFSLLGTRRLRRIKAGKTIFLDHVWGSARWGDARGLGESIPTLNETKILLIELYKLVENILVNDQAEFTLHATKHVIGVGHDRGELLTFHGRIQDRFLLHLESLLADFGSRLKRCDANDCCRIYVSVRKEQQYCSSRCQRRIGARTLRSKKPKGGEGGAKPTRLIDKHVTRNKHDIATNARGESDGKTRRKR